jgi:hypothetical protein
MVVAGRVAVEPAQGEKSSSADSRRVSSSVCERNTPHWQRFSAGIVLCLVLFDVSSGNGPNGHKDLRQPSAAHRSSRPAGATRHRRWISSSPLAAEDRQAREKPMDKPCPGLQGEGLWKHEWNIGEVDRSPIDPTRPWIAFGGLTGRCTCSVARDMSGR